MRFVRRRRWEVLKFFMKIDLDVVHLEGFPVIGLNGIGFGGVCYFVLMYMGLDHAVLPS